jgi:hypothetical protein
LSELPKWLGALIARLLPKQKSEGDHAAQFGKVGGNVTILHVTQHVLTTPVAPPQFESTAPAPLAEPAAQPHRAGGGVANEDQRHVLQLIRRLHDSASVYEFMRREFGTHMVINLQPPQLFRVRRYVEAIIQSGAQVSAATRPFQPVQGNQNRG